MREFFLQIFQESESSLEITFLSIWHILYLLLVIGSAFAITFIVKNKSNKTKQTLLNIFAFLIPALYIADFLIMPLARDDFSIDVDKLPFHLCTIMAFFAPFAQFNKKFEPIKETIVCLTLVGSLMYICYPGSALGDISPFTYKIVQTFLYHGIMFVWAFLSLTIGKVELNFKNIWKEAVGIVIIILWAGFGNVVYSHEGHHFDWFFVTGSSFPFVPSFLMPYVVLVTVFAMCAIIYSIYYIVVNKMIKNNEV
jgi:hypothetical protein